MAKESDSKKLLIIFYRNPELGKVKTRLAATLGDGNALAIYLKLCNHTRLISEDLSCSKALYYSNYIDTEDNWPNELFEKYLQSGDSLGDKMLNAFKEGFTHGYHSICIIGTDCLEITQSILKDAFKSLEKEDVVIGPAKDGGYYLLGMNRLTNDFFKDKNWSTETVAKETIEDCERLGLSYSLLPTLNDIDREEDLPEGFLKKIK